MDPVSGVLIALLLICAIAMAAVCMYGLGRKGGWKLSIASLFVMVVLVVAAWTIATSPEPPSVYKSQAAKYK